MVSRPKPTFKKGLKLKRALARLPARVSLGANGRSPFAPAPGEQPIALLRLRVVACHGLRATDRSGLRDPFAVVSLLGTRHHTPVAKRTTSPAWAPKDATFDFPIYLTLAERLGVVELVLWDKDVLTKDYLGEVAIPLEDWFGGRDAGFGFDDPANEVLELSVVSTRAATPPAGTVLVKLGFVPAPSTRSLLDFDELFDDLVRRARPSLVSAPPTEGVGTVRSHQAGPAFEDDGGLSSDDDDELVTDDEDPDAEPPTPLAHLYAPPEFPPPLFPSPLELQPPIPAPAPEPEPPILVPPPEPPSPLLAPPPISPSIATPTPVSAKTPRTPHFIPKLLSRRTTPVSDTDAATPTPPASAKRSRFARRRTVTQPSPGTASAPPSPSTPAPDAAAAATPHSSPSSDDYAEDSTDDDALVIESAPADLLYAGTDAPPLGVPLQVVISPSPPTTAAAKPSRPLIPKIFPRRPVLTPATSDASVTTPRPDDVKKRKFPRRAKLTTVVPAEGLAAPLTPTLREEGAEEAKKRRFRRARNGPRTDYNFSAANDIVGIVMLEIGGATDLPRLKNRWDMDPFVVISFGKKVFRTRVIRHSRNPVWDEKLLFHVRRYETAFRVQLTVLDWDKLSANDYIGDAGVTIAELVEGAPQPDPATGMYGADADAEQPMRTFRLPLSTAQEMPWEARHTPVLTVRAKYQPYAALRQRFWRQYLRQYADDAGRLAHVELSAALDSLGSTLTRTTLAAFFTRVGKDPAADALTLPEAVAALEGALGRPASERRRVGGAGDAPGSGAGTPFDAIMEAGMTTPNELTGAPMLGPLDFAGPALADVVDVGVGDTPGAPAPAATEPAEVLLTDVAAGPAALSDAFVLALPGTAGVRAPASRQSSYSSDADGYSSGSGRTPPESGGSGSGSAATTPGDAAFERVINVRNCPLCHRPRLNAKAELDIVTHLAVCASGDWNAVGRIVVGNFVTASQAQRKWYTRVIGKVSSGDYRLGANSANIIVQNRMTGQLEEEKMQVYVRLGIRLLYKGAKSRMEGGRARRLLKSLSIKQGIKYDSPESVRDIPAFIAFHKIKVDELRDPLDSFKTFNQFFYRKLKDGARPIECSDDPYRLVSAADCRLMTFATVDEATRLWIKGREFTVARLLGAAHREHAARYAGGALAIFRLAPQDYHRFHSPVDGTIGPMAYVAGEYYTVNPQAVRTALDVYGENARRIVPIESPQFGRVIAVCVGAMMVGSIVATVTEGMRVRRGDELGYFAFGGSTIVLLFEPGVLEWDEDLLVNGRAALETLVRVGMGIGTGRRPGVV